MFFQNWQYDWHSFAAEWIGNLNIIKRYCDFLYWKSNGAQENEILNLIKTCIIFVRSLMDFLDTGKPLVCLWFTQSLPGGISG